MTKSHECSACGGTGGWNVCGRRHGTTTCRIHNCCECEQPWDDPCLYGEPCPVCLGAGRISDRMPVADAIADAETLRPWLPNEIHLTGNGFSTVP